MPGPRPLPDSPDLDQLKRQAKDLLRAARDADPAAMPRFRALPALQHASDDDLARASLALHDAQSVIAREHGFPSWNALRERVEELTLDFDTAAREFVVEPLAAIAPGWRLEPPLSVRHLAHRLARRRPRR